VKDGRLSRVQLTRQDIDAHQDGEEIPIQILEREARTRSVNGTLVEIEDIFLRQIDIPSMIRHIERHIAHWPDATVIVNNHECQYTEPDINREFQFFTRGTPFQESLGDAKLKIKVAKAPLDDEFRGVAILSQGVWYETTLAGCDRKPFAEYLFGTFDVAVLARDQSAIPAFDMSRSMKLNPRNEIVADILRFIGANLEQIRRDLERQDRERRQSEEQKKLQQQGSKIAELINEHFNSWRKKLRSTMAKAGAGKDLLSSNAKSSAKEEGVLPGDELFGVIQDVGIDGEDGPGPDPRPGPNRKQVRLDETSEQKVAKRAAGTTKPSLTGGFSVAFKKIGPNEKRAKYDRDNRTIYINLEHPRIAVEITSSKTRSPIDDPNFLRMAYEIAFTEYAIVLAQELSNAQFFFDPQDALVEVRQTLDDLSKVFATVWKSADAAR
jgi:hypothetical protein